MTDEAAGAVLPALPRSQGPFQCGPRGVDARLRASGPATATWAGACETQGTLLLSPPERKPYSGATGTTGACCTCRPGVDDRKGCALSCALDLPQLPPGARAVRFRARPETSAGARSPPVGTDSEPFIRGYVSRTLREHESEGDEDDMREIPAGR